MAGMNVSELRDCEAQLAELAGRLTSAGDFWGREGAIRYSKKRAEYLRDLGDTAKALSALSSTYYSAFGNAWARVKLTAMPWQWLFWLFRAWRCRGQAVRYSDRLVGLVGNIRSMSSDQLGTRSRVLFADGRYEESLECGWAALISVRRVSEKEAALIRAGIAETLDAMGRRQEALEQYQSVISMDLEPKVAVRVKKSWARHCLLVGDGEQALQVLTSALEIARQNNLGDQVVKLNALFPEL